MIKNFISGVLVGISNIIPGLSGGTTIILLGLFNKTTKSISTIFKKNSNKKESIIFLFELLFGVLVGIFVFSKILDLLFNYFEYQVLFLFFGMILSSVFVFKKKELKEEKINYLFLSFGMLVILILFLFKTDTEFIINEFPKVNLYLLISSFIIGIILGGTMIFPGISGSLIALILGKYYLFKSYVSNALSFELNVLIPIVFIGFGVLLGIVLVSKLSQFLLKKYENKTLSFILGLIIMSLVSIVPFNMEYNFISILISSVFLIIGFYIVKFVENKK